VLIDSVNTLTNRRVRCQNCFCIYYNIYTLLDFEKPKIIYFELGVLYAPNIILRDVILSHRLLLLLYFEKYDKKFASQTIFTKTSFLIIIIYYFRIVEILGTTGGFLTIVRLCRILRPLRAINRVPSMIFLCIFCSMFLFLCLFFMTHNKYP